MIVVVAVVVVALVVDEGDMMAVLFCVSWEHSICACFVRALLSG